MYQIDFKKKTILITGARKGIGRSISELFMIHGATKIIGTSTDDIGVQIINAYLGNQGTGIRLNVTKQESIDSCLQEINKKFGNVDILINNAGISKDNILLNIKHEEWQSIIDVNLTSVYRMSKIVIKSMIKNHYGRIINIGSVIGTIGNAGQISYSTAKSGLIGLTKSLAKEVASRGITVNLVTPGFICTDMTKKLTDKQKSNILSVIPAQRFGEPKDIANAVIFLASNNSSYITGQTLHINGGMYMG